jgi:predicted DNA-binding protein (UPF0251 family)
MFRLHFDKGVGQNVMGETLGVSQQAVSLKLLKSSDKVRKHVANKKWEL